MALSNWATLAFDINGKPCNGTFKNEKSGAVVELYKNWVYVRDPRAWHEEGSDFVKPTVAQINEGDIYVFGFHIHAIRGRQNAIFTVGEMRDPKSEDYKHIYFGGIGCSGFMNTPLEVLKSLGREDEYDPEDDHWMQGMGGGLHTIANVKTGLNITYWDESVLGPYDDRFDKWVGVEQQTLADFFSYLERLMEDEFSYNDAFKAWVENCEKSKTGTFNQGDAFFADKLNFNTPVSEVGDVPPEPILTQMLKKKE